MLDSTGVYFDLREGRSAIDQSGVFAVTAIPARARIGQITGDVISVRAARKLSRASSRLYLIDLTDTLALDCSTGNVLRLLNHSCTSNAFLRIARGRVEVYAKRLIAPGEELTVDYGETPHPGGMACRCASPDCRGRI
jgi:SET domain-containing protein